MTPLLALHGFTGSPRSFEFLGERARVELVPALLGHTGAAVTGRAASFEDEVARLSALAVEAGRVHVLGYSLGARLALGVALRQPKHVTRLTLVSGQPGLASEPERAERRTADAVWIELLRSRGLEAFVDAWQAQPLWATQSALPVALRDRKRGERLSHSALGLAHSLQVTGLAEMPNYWQRLSELRMPLCLVAGGLDAKFSELARLMAAHARHASLHIAPGAGHDLLLERPDFINTLLDRPSEP